MSKAFTSILLWGLLLCSINTIAQPTLSFDPATVSVNNGDQVCFDVTIDNFTDILGAQFSINYDAAALEYASVGNFGLAGLNENVMGLPVMGGIAPGDITVSWFDNALNGVTLPAGTVLFEVCFDAIGNDVATDVVFSGDPTAIQFIDTNNDILNFETNDAAVTIGTPTGGNTGDFTFNMTSASGNQGDQVCLDVSVDNFTDILGVQFSIDYDPAQLEYVSVGNFGLAGLNENVMGLPVMGGTSAGDITVSWFDNSLNGVTVGDGTVLFEVCFEILGSSGTAAVDFSGTPTSIQIIDVDNNILPFETNNGTVTIDGGGGNPGDFTFNMTSASGNPGDQVCLDVSVDNFTDILGVQFSIDYDPAQLEYVSVGNFGLAGLNENVMGLPVMGGTMPGDITVSWFDNSLNGVTVGDGTVLFEVCFEILGSSGTAAVDFSGTPTSIQIIDVDNNILPFETNNGTVTIDGGGGNPGDFTFNMTSASGNPGDQVCLDVSVDNFTDILGVQFSIDYDPAQLEYVSVGNFGLAGLNENVMGLPVMGGTMPGDITVSWFDNSLNGVTVGDGTVLFEVCFEILGSSGTAAVDFSGTPTSIQIIDVDNNILPFETNNGTVTIDGGGGNPGDFTFNMTSASGNPGDQVCLDVSVDNFTDILGVQFSIDYDPAQLEYVSVGNFGLAGLNENVMGLPVMGGTMPGDITVSWFDNSLNGVTVGDGTVLFEVCFEILGSSGTAAVDFSGTPTSIQIIDVDNNILPFETNNGTVTIDGGGGNPGDFTFNMTSASGNPGDQVCLDVSVDNFTDILGVQFSIDYDPAQLEYVSVGNFGLAGLNENVMGLPVMGGTSAGDITVSWFDNSLNGVTVGDGTVLFEVCFEILASSGTAAVDFSGTPTSIQIIDVDNNILPFETNNGTVTIDGGGGNTGDFTFNMTSASGNPGDQVCLDVSVDNFTDILGVQFSIDYDPAQLEYVSVGNFGLAGLNENVMGLPVMGGTMPGDITVSWFDNSLNGVTVGDGTVLFEVCFEILASSGTAAVDFSGTPTSIQIIDVDNNILPFETNNGTVTIGGGNPGDFTFNMTSASGNQGDQVCLDVSVDNFTDILGVQFSIDYDPAQLEYVSVGNFGLAGLNENVMGLPVMGGTMPGDITVSWFDNSLNGVTVGDGTVLFEVCFEILASSGTAAVDFSGTPTSIQIIDVDNNILPFETNNGTVTIGGGNPGDFTFNVSDVMGQQGDQVCLDVTVDNFTDILGVQFSLDYDPAALQYVSVGNFGIPGLNENVMGLPVMGGTMPGDITVSWFDNSLNGVTVADGTVLFEVCFEILIGTGSTPVDVSDMPTAVQVIDSDNNIISSVASNGTVSIGTTPTGDEFALNASDETVTGVGTQACVAITADNFTDILGVQFSLDYDPTKLEYASVGNFGIPGLNANVMGLPIPGGTSAGDITVSWFDNSLNGVSVADGTVLFEVCFNALELGTHAVDFSDMPTDIQIIDSDNNILLFETNNGSVTAEMDDTPMFDNFALLLSDENTMTGNTVCLDVTTQNFTDILGAQFSIDYDPNALEYASVGNFGLAGLNENVMGLPVMGGTMPGDITVSWFDNSLSGVSIPDNTVLFEVCFVALLDSGSTPVTFSDNPTLIQVIDINNSILPYDIDNGSVSIGDVPPPADFEWTISDAEVCPDDNQDFCVDITVTGFQDILGAQFSINYDPAEMDFVSVSNFGLPDLTENQFGVPGDGTNAGAVTMAWFDNSLNGVSVADGTTVFTLCFSPTGMEGTSTQIDFSGMPTPIQILDVNNDELDLVGNAGTITYSCAPSDPPVITMPAMITDVDCNGDATGAIDIEVTGGSGNYSYSWDVQNATTQDVSGLSAGTYNVTVTDDVTMLTTTGTFTVDEPNSAVVITLTQVTDVSCNGDSDGSIGIIAGGGTGVLTYAWNNGLPAVPNPSGLAAAADYQVTITDENGCELISDPIEITEPAVLSLSGQVEDIACNGESTGTISLTIGGGTPTYSIDWAGDLTDDVTTQNMLSGGTYGVTVSDVNGCEQSGSFEVMEPDAIIISSTVENVICSGAATGSIDLTIEGGTGAYTIDWAGLTDGETTQTELEAGMYSVTVTDENGCEAVETFDITEPDTPIEITVTTENVECNGGPTGSISLDITGGVPDYDIVWSDGLPAGQTMQDQLEAGSYSVTITDAGGCEVVETIVVNSDAPIFITGMVTDASCNGDENGAISITIAGGTSDFTIDWQDGLMDGQTMQDNLAAGTYSLTVTDNNTSCVKIENFEVSEPNVLSLSTDVTNVVCNGESNGTIDLTINGGTPDYSITWSDGLPADATNLTDLAAGTYSATITDQNNCTIEPSFMVTEPDVLTISASIQEIDCFNDNDGEIAVTVTGGTPTYTLDWAEPLTDGFMTQSNLSGGTYQLTVTDDNGCTQDAMFELVNPAELIIDDITPTDVFLGDDGEVNITVIGGTMPLTYSWDGPSQTGISQDEDLTGLNDLGEYCVTVTDANGCTVTACTSIKLRLQFGIVEIIENCPGSESGSVTVEVLGGVPDYTFDWDVPDAPNSNQLTGLVEGTYSLTVTDQEGMTISGEFTLGTYPEIIVSSTVTPAEGLVNNTNGAIDLDISGGAPGYDIVWDNGATGALLENVSAGEYCVTITDQNGCTFEACYTVDFVALPLVVQDISTEDAVCPGEASGSISLSVFGGVPVYSLNIPGLGAFTSVSGNFLVSNVAPGTYSYTVIDNEGQTISGMVEVGGPDPIIISSVDVTHDTEAPGGTGIIQITVQGGTPPYDYSWNALGASGSTIINLPAGSYAPTITDSRGCEASFPGIIVNEFGVSGASTPNNCPMDGLGAIDLMIEGGEEPYTYNWSGPGAFSSTDEDISGLNQGIYNVTITEGSGNTIVKAYIVGVLSDLTLGINVESNYNNFAVSCEDATDGIVSANALLGGEACMDCLYEWELDGALVGVDATLSDVGTGTYNLTVVDPFGCSTESSITLGAPSPLAIQGSIEDVSCEGEADGEIVVLVTGGVSTQYFYNWSDGGSLNFRNADLVSGIYELTVSDLNSCTAVAAFEVLEPAPLSITVQTEPATELEPCNGSVWVIVTGGNAPYRYDWMNADVPDNSTSLVEGLCPGDYFIEITDANNCVTSQETVVATVENKAFPCFSERVVITPDGNGTNDEFIIFCVGDFPDNHLEIYNRWGQLVFEADNYDNTWEGTTGSGEPLPEGAYYYILEYFDNSIGEEVQQRGSITLLRE
jgi:gliding motility-associated-like protein